MASAPPQVLPRSFLPAIAAVDYPPSFPLPDRTPYSFGVDMGLIRSEMAAGNARQRRMFRHMPTTFALQFHMDTATLFQWQVWANQYAFDWFNLPLADAYAGYAGALITSQAARFTGDLRVALDGHDWWAVSVPAELNFGLAALLPDPNDLGWIVAGTPAAPSPDRVIAGTPGASPFAVVFNFVDTELIDPKITAAGGANGTRVNSAGLIVAATAPRYDYDPVTRAARGVLIEETRKNLAVQSEAFDSATWGKWQVYIIANAAISPAGTMTADKQVENATNNTHGVYAGAITAPATANYAYSVYAKAAERSRIYLVLSDSGGANSITGNFDLAAGKVVSTAGAGFGVVRSASITPVGGGWYRCTISGVPSTSGSAIGATINLADNSGNGTYAGDGASGFYMWGLQIEAGHFATSYIPTVAAAVTRSADMLTVTGANFSSWWDNAAGTYFVTLDRAGLGPAVLIEADDGSQANRFVTYMDFIPQLYSIIQVGGATVASAPPGDATIPAPFTVAHAYQAGDFAVSVNGQMPMLAAPATLPNCNRLLLCNDGSAVQPNGHLRAFGYIPHRIANADLQALAAAPPPLATYPPTPPMPLQDFYIAGTPAFPAAPL